MIDILGAKPLKMDADALNYSNFIYSKPKLGKSTFLHKLYGDRALFVFTEDRYKHLAGINHVRVYSWAEYLTVLSQLQNPLVREKYDIVVVDTIDNLFNMLVKHTCSKFGITALGEDKNSWSADYIFLREEWADKINMIANLGYKPSYAGHCTVKTEKIPLTDLTTEAAEMLGAKVVEVKEKDGKTGTKVKNKYYEIEKYVPDVKEKYMGPINKNVDNILFLNLELDKDGNETRVIHLRGTLQYDAGCTFENVPDTIEATPSAYMKAIEDAINQVSPENKEFKPEKTSVIVDFEIIKKEAMELGVKYVKAGKKAELDAIIAKHVGLDKKLGECTEINRAVVQSTLDELKLKAAKLGVEV